MVDIIRLTKFAKRLSHHPGIWLNGRNFSISQRHKNANVCAHKLYVHYKKHVFGFLDNRQRTCIRSYFDLGGYRKKPAVRYKMHAIYTLLNTHII